MAHFGLLKIPRSWRRFAARSGGCEPSAGVRELGGLDISTLLDRKQSTLQHLVVQVHLLCSENIGAVPPRGVCSVRRRIQAQDLASKQCVAAYSLDNCWVVGAPKLREQERGGASSGNRDDDPGADRCFSGRKSAPGLGPHEQPCQAGQQGAFLQN